MNYTIEDLKRIRLYNQHITNKTHPYKVLTDLNGIQAQFLNSALHNLKIRSDVEINDKILLNVTKNWTIRGTVHIFNASENKLYIHNVDTQKTNLGKIINGNKEVSKNRELFFANLLINLIKKGVSDREELKQICINYGMNQKEMGLVFDQWGGTLKTLCTHGIISYKIDSKKRYIINEHFSSIEKRIAEGELIERYFKNFGPATVDDCKYYFSKPLKEIKQLMKNIELNYLMINGIKYYYYGELKEKYPDIPNCVFLANFDQLLLGYEKKNSIFFDSANLRDIYTLSGIVASTILFKGKIVGKWKRNNNKIIINLFEKLSNEDKEIIYNTAKETFTEIIKIEYI